MKGRAEAVKYISALFTYDIETSREKDGKTHFGLQEMRDVLDFIYEGPPENDAQKLVDTHGANKY